MNLPKPFQQISTELLNDMSDSSSIELDGIVLGSQNSWEGGFEDTECPIQKEIHDTISRTRKILEDYRDGKLVYVFDTGEPQPHGYVDQDGGIVDHG